MPAVPRPARGVRVKICGLTAPADVDAAAASGAAYMGLVFFPASPRALTPAAAAPLALRAPVGMAKVALLVDADDATLDAVVGAVALDMVQLHGRETPARVAEIRARTGLPVMKAVGLRDAADLAEVDRHEAAADQILVDAKPPRGAPVPGGNGIGFDWGLLVGRRWARPWMLAGGLTPGNVAEAARLTGARQVDVSSGVEAAPGRKDPGLIAAFCAAARDALPADRPPG